MHDQDLTDSQWERLQELVPGGRKGKRGPRSDGRQWCCPRLSGHLGGLVEAPEGAR